MPDQPLKGFHIAITRPAGQAGKLADAISRLGGASFPFPLIAIVPLGDYRDFEQKLDTLDNCDWAIFISSNAVHNAMPRLLSRFGKIPQKLNFAAIGPATATELAKAGVARVLAPKERYDSESLLALPEMQNVRQRRIIIFRGAGGRELLGNTLKSRGALVEYAECYQRINPQTSANVLATRWQNKQFDAIVVTSSETMRHLLDLAGQPPAEWIKNVVLCVNHERIAELPLALGLKTAVAKAPGDEAMLQCLIESLQKNNR